MKFVHYLVSWRKKLIQKSERERERERINKDINNNKTPETYTDLEKYLLIFFHPMKAMRHKRFYLFLK